MKTEQTAIKFYKEIQEQENKYKLVNGLFIVKYINKDICVYVGDFLKGGCALNNKKTNFILISDNENPQEFNKSTVSL